MLKAKPWKRWVGWYMAVSGAWALLAYRSGGLTSNLVVGAWTMWGAWWVVSNPPADGYLVVRAWRALFRRGI